MEYKIFFGYLAVFVEFISYFVYLHSIYKGHTKPHAFTWFVWSVLNSVAFAAIVVSGGESGSWVFIVNAIFCFLISCIGFWQKHVEYDLHDWIALIGALVGITLWWYTHIPLYAVILISLSDFIGIIPSLRKAYRLPFEENLSSWFLSFLYYPLGILALESLTLSTWLYPAVIMLADATLIGVIIIQRKKLKSSSGLHV